MAATYTCDMCERPVRKMDLGNLTVRGIDPTGKRSGRYFRHEMDLCPICAKGAFRAIQALAEASKGKP
jgi:hypothetical protein